MGEVRPLLPPEPDSMRPFLSLGPPLGARGPIPRPLVIGQDVPLLNLLLVLGQGVVGGGRGSGQAGGCFKQRDTWAEPTQYLLHFKVATWRGLTGSSLSGGGGWGREQWDRYGEATSKCNVCFPFLGTSPAARPPWYAPRGVVRGAEVRACPYRAPPSVTMANCAGVGPRMSWFIITSRRAASSGSDAGGPVLPGGEGGYPFLFSLGRDLAGLELRHRPGTVAWSWSCATGACAPLSSAGGFR